MTLRELAHDSCVSKGSEYFDPELFANFLSHSLCQLFPMVRFLDRAR